MDVEVRTAERRIADIALGQHGNVTRAQLLGAGLSRRQSVAAAKRVC
jgi:hypothetical protein